MDCYRAAVLKLQHALQSSARLVEIPIAGLHHWSSSFSSGPRICIVNKFPCFVDSGGPGPHHRRRGDGYSEQSDSEHDLDFNHLHFCIETHYAFWGQVSHLLHVKSGYLYTIQ